MWAWYKLLVIVFHIPLSARNAKTAPFSVSCAKSPKFIVFGTVR